jgi:RND family efflux transporter MFP subunit
MNTMNFRRLFFIAIFVASQPLAANAPDPAYSSMPAVDCVINPYRVVDISSPVAGVIETLHVERSQQVAAGQVVAQLEASVERANVELARYRAGVESEIELGKVNINFDQLRKKRVDSLLEEQNISRENADQIEREVQLSMWKLKQARELADIRRLELRKAEEQLRQKSIPAPFDGFVLDTFKYRGEYVEDQAILRLAQLDPLVVEAIVPMENFGLIKPGMEAEVLPEVLLKEKLRGQVIAVDRIGDTASNTFGVKLSMPNPENRIPAGLKCIVKFLEKTPEQVARKTEIETIAETPKGQIERPVEPPEPQARKVVLNSSTIVDSSVLLASISSANAEITPATEPVEVNDPTETGTLQQVASLTNDIVIDTPTELEMAPTSYMVLIEQPETKAATRDLVARLRDAGVNDFLVFNNGANKGHISLGVFSTRANALNRQQALDELGFASFTIERYQ